HVSNGPPAPTRLQDGRASRGRLPGRPRLGSWQGGPSTSTSRSRSPDVETSGLSCSRALSTTWVRSPLLLVAAAQGAPGLHPDLGRATLYDTVPRQPARLAGHVEVAQRSLGRAAPRMQ